MQKVKENNNSIIFFLIGFTILSYFLGFFLNENSAGGGQGDFGNTWKNIAMFKSNGLFEAIKLTATGDSNIFQSSRIPGVYVFHKLFNPFTNNISQFKSSIFFFSFLIPVALYISLRIQFETINKTYLVLISSLIFLSPYFRTSAYWGNEENFGLLAIIISYIFLQLFTNAIVFKNGFFYLNMLAFFSSCCVYFDQKLAFVPAISLIIILLSKKRNFFKYYLILIFCIYSIPVLYLFNLWGGMTPPVDGLSRNMLRVNEGNLQGNLYPQHFGYSISIIGFYMLPFFFIIKDKIIKDLGSSMLNKKNYILYFILLSYILYFLIFYEINDEVFLGKGVFYKLAFFTFEDPIFKKIFLSLVILFFGLLILNFIKKDFRRIFIVLFLCFTSIIYWPVLQEYFDPLIYIIMFTFFNYKFYFTSKNIFFLYSYFFIFLVISNFYYSLVLPNLN